MVRSIDPGCEQIRGTHWPNTGRVVDWNSCRGNHLGQRPNKLHQKAGHMDASDPIRPQKTLAARGPSTYGSRRSPGRRGVRASPPPTAQCAAIASHARPMADMANEGLKKSLVYDRLSFLVYD